MDELIRLYSRLNSLKTNLPSDHMTHVKYVTEYHDIISNLENVTKTSLEEFKITSNEIQPYSYGGNYVTGENYYTEDSFCEKQFFLSKIDALLSYFSLTYLGKEQPKIGFQPK